MREIIVNEIPKLNKCLQSLSEYYNEVSNNFKGSYPSRPYKETLQLFEEAITSNLSKIAVIEKDNDFIGFCKVDICGENGILDYLSVLKEYRAMGYGKALMDWAMDTFKKWGVR